MKLLELNCLDKYFDSDQVLFDVSFSIYKGDVVGFLGPNGAGKSTTLKIISGTLEPDSGEVYFKKQSIYRDSNIIRNKIGYLPENPPVYDYLKVSENLDFFSQYRCEKLSRKSSINRSIDLCGLSEVRNKLAGALSKGYRQRLGLGIALLGDPELLILDEPTSGLDPIQIQETRKLIRNLSEDKTILLSSHILSEVSELCNRLVIIDKGLILAEDKTEELMKNISTTAFIIELKAPREEVYQQLTGFIPGDVIREISNPGDSVLKLMILEGDEIRSRVLKVVSENGWNLISINKQEPTLENIFINFVKNGNDEDISDN